MLRPQGFFGPGAFFHQVADDPQAPEGAGGEHQDGAGQQSLQGVAGALVGGDAEFQAVTGRLERQFVGQAGDAFDVRFGAELYFVVVDHDDPVFLGEPPGHQVVEQSLDRVIDDQHAGQFALGVNRHGEREMADVTGEEERFAVNALAQSVRC